MFVAIAIAAASLTAQIAEDAFKLTSTLASCEDSIGDQRWQDARPMLAKLSGGAADGVYADIRAKIEARLSPSQREQLFPPADCHAKIEGYIGKINANLADAEWQANRK